MIITDFIIIQYNKIFISKSKMSAVLNPPKNLKTFIHKKKSVDFSSK